jgi:rfaE bifunctional protein kinase chain/domain
MKDIAPDKLKDTVQNFAGKRIIVLGDLMLDKFIWGDVTRISPEAPIPVVEVKEDTSCLGGAGNVCHNLESLGAFPLLTGIVGDDPEGEWVKDNVPDNRGIITIPGRPTTVKTRIIAHHQQVVRVDREKKHPVSPELETEILRFIQSEDYDGIIISDYNKGILTKSLVNQTLIIASREKTPVFVDPKIENFDLFSPVTLITPNHHEAEKIVHHECTSDADVERAGLKIISRISVRYLIIKRGEQGISVFEKGKAAEHIPAISKEVYDVTGAGDTVIATAALALLSGATISEAAVIANTAAGIVVGKLGTATLTPEELITALTK